MSDRSSLTALLKHVHGSIVVRVITPARIRAQAAFTPLTIEADRVQRQTIDIELPLDVAESTTKGMRVFGEPLTAILLNDVDEVADPDSLLARRDTSIFDTRLLAGSGGKRN